MRHRPRTFADLVGQQHVTSVLSHAIEAGTLPQQLLFVGGSGLGKTTVARITAAALLCQDPVRASGVDACGQCRSCSDIFAIEGPGHPDVVELDAASNGGKDEIRSLAERSSLASSRGGMKVYIIDEAHALSGAGGSALLKLLEEPPAHVVFMLASTDPQKILKPNRGRCTEFALLRPSEQVMADNLVRVACSEGWTLLPEVAQLVVTTTDPDLGVRGTLMSLEKLAPSLSKGALSVQDARYLLGRGGMEPLLEALHGRDLRAALLAAAEVVAVVGEGPVRAELLDRARRGLLDAAGGSADLAAAGQTLRSVATAPAGPAGVLLAVAALLDGTASGVDVQRDAPGNSGNGRGSVEATAEPDHRTPTATSATATPAEARVESGTGDQDTGRSTAQPTAGPQALEPEPDPALEPINGRGRDPEPETASETEPVENVSVYSVEDEPELPVEQWSAQDYVEPRGRDQEEGGRGTGDREPHEEIPQPSYDPQAVTLSIQSMRENLAEGHDPFDSDSSADQGFLEYPQPDVVPTDQIADQSVSHQREEGTPRSSSVRKSHPQPDSAGLQQTPVQDLDEQSTSALADKPLGRAFLMVLRDTAPEVAALLAASGLQVDAGPGVVVLRAGPEAVLLLRRADVNKACRAAASQLGVRLKAEPI